MLQSQRCDARWCSPGQTATSARSRSAALAILLQAKFSDAKVIKKCGAVLDDLSSL
jgi:hypothetical protein